MRVVSYDFEKKLEVTTMMKKKTWRLLKQRVKGDHEAPFSGPSKCNGNSFWNPNSKIDHTNKQSDELKNLVENM